MNIDRIGGYSALLQCALWVTFGVFVLSINPLVGLAGPSDLDDPNRLLPALHEYPALIVFPGLDAAVGASLLVTVLVVRQRLRTARSSLLDQSAVTCGVLAAALFVVLSISRVSALPALADWYTTNHAAASEMFLVSNALHQGIANATRLALGTWWILSSILALHAAVLPKWLVYFGIALGTMNCTSAYFVPLAGPNLLLVPIYFGGLAFFLVRREHG
jgi:hypothetical protein